MLLDINLIDIGDRIREDPGQDFDELVTSIKGIGQLQSIVVKRNGNGTFQLIAGERRLRAITLLHGRGDAIGREGSIFHCPPLMVRAEIEGELSDEVALMMEFEENVRRKDFSWEEKAKYVRKFHNLFATRANAAGNEWSQEMTAFALKLDPGQISRYLELDKVMEKHPEVAKAKTMRGALKRVKVIKEHESRLSAAMKDTENAGLKKASEVLTQGDGIAWLKTIPDGSVDLVNLDPPWGDEASYKTKQASWEEFDDSLEYSQEIIHQLLTEAFRVLKDNRFCIFWYRTWAYREMCDLATSKGFSLKHSKTPCIWFKPDKISDKMAWPEKQLITSYETFLLLRKGDPVFYEKEVQNVFVEARVPTAELIHQTEKPASLMERLVRLTTTPSELVVDPCAGSASCLAAGYKAFRKIKGCELGDVNYERALLRLAGVMK